RDGRGDFARDRSQHVVRGGSRLARQAHPRRARGSTLRAGAGGPSPWLPPARRTDVGVFSRRSPASRAAAFGGLTPSGRGPGGGRGVGGGADGSLDGADARSGLLRPLPPAQPSGVGWGPWAEPLLTRRTAPMPLAFRDCSEGDHRLSLLVKGDNADQRIVRLVLRLAAFALGLSAALPSLAQSPGNFSSLSATGTATLNGDVLMCSGKPWIDVRCDGAVGDGSHDDTTAINATIATAITNGWPVHF